MRKNKVQLWQVGGWQSVAQRAELHKQLFLRDVTRSLAAPEETNDDDKYRLLPSAPSSPALDRHGEQGTPFTLSDP